MTGSLTPHELTELDKYCCNTIDSEELAACDLDTEINACTQLKAGPQPIGDHAEIDKLNWAGFFEDAARTVLHQDLPSARGDVNIRG